MTPSQRLSVLGEGRLLQIQPTQVSDSGRYLCVATNMAGEDDQDFNVLIQGACGAYCRVGWVSQHLRCRMAMCFLWLRSEIQKMVAPSELRARRQTEKAGRKKS